ncbi:hypothetical protein [Shewanella sp. GXUN23E]|uniref:hypothetical protein n=1 Tax=Shewanella sp. GXUN23E TaxID=3422498 RepID=UPI003D7F14BB
MPLQPEWSAPAPRALVCELDTLTSCLAQLPASARVLLLSPNEIRHALGGRNAMALPMPMALPESPTKATSPLARQRATQIDNDPQPAGVPAIRASQGADIAGVVVLDKGSGPEFIQTILDGRAVHLDLVDQQQLSLWHELGHLAISRLDYGHHYSPNQHESLADLYMLWLSARLDGDFRFGWQQYHRRNLALINDRIHLSHWSVPVLYRAMSLLSVAQLASFTDFAGIVSALALEPGGAGWLNEDDLAEYASLVQRVFGQGVVQPLPGYLYWRRPQLGIWMGPTLTHLLGDERAARLMAGHALQIDSDVSVGPQLNVR